MHFIINTAVGNHFCALFDTEKNLVATHQWEINRRDGMEVFAFLESQTIYQKKITFIGGVTGPGGFTSLRVSSSILNALSFKYDLPIHQISAPEWVQDFLGHNRFVLNSFSDTVWVQSKKCEVGSPESGVISRTSMTDLELKRIPVTEAAELFADQDVLAHFLPEPKKHHFSQLIDIKSGELPKRLLEALLKTEPKNYFKAFYNVSPVN